MTSSAATQIMVPTNTGKLISLPEYLSIIKEVRAGKPRRYMETFLKIETPQGIIPWKFNENQVYFDENVFGSLSSFNNGFFTYALKDRKATFSTWVAGVAFTFTSIVPSFQVVMIGAMEEHAETFLRMTDVFYNNLPDTRDAKGNFIFRPTKSHWDQSYREFAFGPMVGDALDIKATSSITISNSRSTAFGRGKTPKMVVFDEKAHFSQEHEPQLMPAILDSLPSSSWRFDCSTPNGSKNGFANDFKDIRDGKVRAIYLFRRWFDNKVNAIGVNDFHVRPEDDAEIRRSGTLEYTEEELGLIKIFPADDVPVLNRILWRRWKISEAIRSSLGDETRGRAVFLQEHPENDVDCWFDIANPIFDATMLRRMIDNAKPPLPDSKLREAGLSPAPLPGMQFRAWQLPYPNGRYYGGMDLANGTASGDASVLQIFDATSGTFVAELYTKARATPSAIEAAKIMAIYNMGVFAPEANGLGESVVEAVHEYGYKNLYYAESREAVRIDKITTRKYGWYTTGTRTKDGELSGTRAKMFRSFQEGFANGLINIPNLSLATAIKEWNPDPEAEEHAGDSMIAAMIAYAVSLEAHRFTTATSAAPRPMAGQQIRVVVGRLPIG